MEVHSMNCIKTIAGSALALMLTFGGAVAWGQSAPQNVTAAGATAAYNTSWSTRDNPSLMDQNLSGEIKQAWSEGKDATGAMAFQENGEIAMSKGEDEQATQYFQAAERELGTLQPDHTSY
jgi:hypothetical protein